MVSLLSTLLFALLTNVSSVLCWHPPSQRSIEIRCRDLHTKCLMDPHTNNSQFLLQKFIQIAGLSEEVICKGTGEILIRYPSFDDEFDKLRIINYCQALREASSQYASYIEANSIKIALA